MGKLIWIASYPKSGTTWVRAFLHNYIRQPATPHDINALMDLSTGESGASRYRAYDPRPPATWSIADVQRMRPRVHRDLMATHPDLVFVKTHNAALSVAGIPLITPEVTAARIYILRDPRDVAISYSRHLGLTLDDTIAFMANPKAATGGTDHEVYELLSTWSAHVESWTSGVDPTLHLLRYEDLIETPEASFGGLIEFLGQVPPKERLSRAINFSAFPELQSQERRAGFIERPAQSTAPFFGSGRPGRWREVLSAAQRRRIERDHTPIMARFGYLF